MQQILKKGKRYKLMLGKFGTYFHDDHEDKDLTNMDIFLLLEKLQELNASDNEVAQTRDLKWF